MTCRSCQILYYIYDIDHNNLVLSWCKLSPPFILYIYLYIAPISILSHPVPNSNIQIVSQVSSHHHHVRKLIWSFICWSFCIQPNKVLVFTFLCQCTYEHQALKRFFKMYLFFYPCALIGLTWSHSHYFLSQHHHLMTPVGTHALYRHGAEICIKAKRLRLSGQLVSLWPIWTGETQASLWVNTF